MRFFRRVSAPQLLQDHADRWNRQWSALRRRSPGARFNWYIHQGRPVNQLISEPLFALTDGRCAYCDHFPLGVEADPTIDHHRPKSGFPGEAYTWENLYGVCRACQDRKGEQWELALLRPDDPEFDFNRYFDFNPSNGELDPRKDADPADYERADCTIRILGLNLGNKPKARLDAIRRPPSEEDRPYRYLWD